MMAEKKQKKIASREEWAEAWIAPIDARSDRDKRIEKERKEQNKKKQEKGMGGAFRKAVSAEEAIKKGEIAAGIRQPDPIMPYGPGEVIKSGEVAREWTGPKPWQEWTDLQRKSTAGSKPFSNEELKQGYRKVK